MITDERIQQILARVEAATPGPWDPCTLEDHCSAVTSGNTVISLAITQGTVHANARTRADGEFIAAARRDVPDLLAEVRRLREHNSAYLKVLCGIAISHPRLVAGLGITVHGIPGHPLAPKDDGR